MNSKINRVSKGKKVNKFGENYSINIRLNLKTRFVSEKKKSITGSDFYATNNSKASLPIFVS